MSHITSGMPFENLISLHFFTRDQKYTASIPALTPTFLSTAVEIRCHRNRSGWTREQLFRTTTFWAADSSYGYRWSFLISFCDVKQVRTTFLRNCSEPRQSWHLWCLRVHVLVRGHAWKTSDTKKKSDSPRFISIGPCFNQKHWNCKMFSFFHDPAGNSYSRK